jgi:hypothetical protein
MKTLFEEESVHYLKLGPSLNDFSQSVYTVLEYSFCFGTVNFNFVVNPLTDAKEIQPMKTIERNGKHRAAFKNSDLKAAVTGGDSLYVVVESVSAGKPDNPNSRMPPQIDP